VLLDLLIWGARHEATAAPCSVIAQMEQKRDTVLKEAYRRWQQRDPTPLIPPFNEAVKSPKPESSPKGKSKL
jgi:hypothetical protein